MSQTLQSLWVAAKAENDFKTFAAPFAELLAVVREIAAAKAEALGTTPYGAMIDEYDPGVGEAMIDPIFADLAGFLPPLIAEVHERQAELAARRSRSAPVPEDRQAMLSQPAGPGGRPSTPTTSASTRRRTPSRCRTAPATCASPPATTSHNIRFAIMATLHEAGHAMYEYNLPRDFAFRPAGVARGA